ncbi:MAG TPA: GNAT family N-acetyltransferase [Rhabdaerophilum sp.]|nr:GNAT family N-acetyltransferase [Rhabdaerophilum sp.]
MTGELQIQHGWMPGLLGEVIAEHGRYYEAYWQLGAAFEAKVAGAIGEWFARYDPDRDLILHAHDATGLIGSISLDGTGHPADGGRIRFFIMAERARGTGLGQRLLTRIMDFAHSSGQRKLWLTTFRGLGAARHLYEQAGFRLTGEALDETWGRPLHEQRFEWQAGNG